MKFTNMHKNFIENVGNQPHKTVQLLGGFIYDPYFLGGGGGLCVTSVPVVSVLAFSKLADSLLRYSLFPLFFILLFPWPPTNIP